MTSTLIKNAHVFDGVHEKLIRNANVLVEGNLIKEVSTSAVNAPGAAVIDAHGRTMTPGFIDAHAHMMFQLSVTARKVRTMDPGRPVVRALAVLDGKVLSTGTLESMKPWLSRHEVTVDEVLERLRRVHREEKDPTRPIIGWGFDPATQGGALDRKTLDSISAERPIWIIAVAPHFA